MSDLLEEAWLEEDGKLGGKVAEGEGLEPLNMVLVEAKFRDVSKDPREGREEDQSEGEGGDAFETGMQNEVEEQGASSQAERLPVEGGKVLNQAGQDGHKGGPSVFHLFRDSEDVLELVCDNQGSSSGNVTDQDAAADELQEVCKPEKSAHDAEGPHHETEQGH